MRCVHLFGTVDYNISNESLKKNNIGFGQGRQFETPEKCRSKLGHRSPNWFLLSSSCMLLIIRKYRYSFLWEGTGQQAYGFNMDPCFLMSLPQWDQVYGSWEQQGMFGVCCWLTIGWTCWAETTLMSVGEGHVTSLWSLSWLCQVFLPQGVKHRLCGHWRG